MRFKVGDRVRIRKDSIYYGKGKFNPSNEIGTVDRIRVYDNYQYLVKWKNCTNDYREDDLELADLKINPNFSKYVKMEEKICL